MTLQGFLPRLSLVLVAWVVVDDLGTQPLGVDVGIYLGGAYVFVAEHALYDTQVGAALEQVGGKGVTESVRADGLLDSCLLGQHLDDVEHGDARQALLEVGTYKQVILVAGLDGYLGTVGHIVHDFGDGPL